MRRIALLAAVAGLAPAAPALAHTATDRGAARVRLLWATINVCDPQDHAGLVGVRGSMPGAADADVELFMRFGLQFFRPSTSRWVTLTGADSGWVDVGSGDARARQAGRTLKVRPPTGRAILVRGVVLFEWREATTVLRHTRRLTTGGHPGTVGADPATVSAPMCSVG
jgi:hypothetical protein